MGAQEAKVERYLDKKVRDAGGLTRKWVSPNHVGVPDRIVVLHGKVSLVEVKTVTAELSPMQQREHQRLRDAGAHVVTVYGTVDVDKFMKGLL